MSIPDLTATITTLKEWEAIAADAAAEVEALKDTIKREMEARGVEELQAGQYIARYTTVLSNRLDSTAMKRQIPEVYNAFVKQVTSRRFTVA